MTDLHDIQRQIVSRITAAPTGSALRFALMDAADAVSRAIEAESKHGAQTADFRPTTTLKPSAGGPEALAPNSEDTTR